jgi:hypothetical protein
MLTIQPDIIVYDTELEWIEVLLISAGGGAAVLLLQAGIAAAPDLWRDLVRGRKALVEWWRSRRRRLKHGGAIPPLERADIIITPGLPLVDLTAEDPSTFDADSDSPHPPSILDETRTELDAIADRVTRRLKGEPLVGQIVDHDEAWRAMGRVPMAIPDNPPPRWYTSRVGLHLIGCKSGVKPNEPQPEILSWQQAAAYAEEHTLRPCHVCDPLAEARRAELAELAQT